ncbi:MAG: tRNA (adenosine(37)-N6)-threonylcarbamoyltransferase complex ATPase subunit type 1 TsaE [Actinobacteria bacterium]|nr:tRNA (adenosine(37)-N6)-threonylcarbamoyltransferase complex ATPase subunit type 1 TsaE [Micrococcales bacterium]MCB9429055.1 tRNA (adenosine(37)-N6)-threonylcarbamoyltransferase complex ATPase subunit type 1 TsaE [Actinomycetota bacterium]HPE11554.1 tRNA (adenosine(37)-N6)-threonylcarbamoyltransferase complex ATPase subunit type 1 TsaE [Actinomycetota bacterium]HPQ83214.1 tRNA (adenosine(37)-N6)-threonylcarbamoyltransferase complex ATPase subunit type 1 TsaE [Actinomycetota bacterium]
MSRSPKGSGALPSAIVREVDSPAAMVELGRLLGMRLRAGDVVLLSGELGAGKTTLMRGLGEGLGVRGPVTSPTFVIARRHPSLVGGPDLIHADAYRLGSAGEFEDLDLADEQAVVCVEWGRDRAEQLSARRLEIDIETVGEGRTVRIAGIDRTVPL